ncbi:hypothetical protein LCGC14_0783860 [marine sediment metagenome]|uniref:Roadblock/LAMTOR2 domain-containing protein n=1 Tax=marine sediment metagenome TaxID=412755 RepID=A0A0F9PUX0_9ZZZZ
MSSISEDISKKIMYVLKDEENKTDLENLQILSREGMKVASAESSEMDADATSASSTALIDLGLRLNQATGNGALTEIILHNSSGYCILITINNDLIIFGGLTAVYRIGYYLGYLRELARKLNRLVSGDEGTEMALSLESAELEKIEKQKREEKLTIKKPSPEQDKAALDDLLGFLDEWDDGGEEFGELEAGNEINVVSIPKTIGLETDKDIKLPVPLQAEEISIPKKEPEFKVYDDEVPPIPLDDYAQMIIEENPVSEVSPSVEESPIPEVSPSVEESPIPESFPSSSNLPSLEDLGPPEFESSATEYDTEFVLEEESEALGSVLKDLGWDQEED